MLPPTERGREATGEDRGRLEAGGGWGDAEPVAHPGDGLPQARVQGRERSDCVFGGDAHRRPLIVFAKCRRKANRVVAALTLRELRADPSGGEVEEDADPFAADQSHRNRPGELVTARTEARLLAEL